MNYDPRHRIEHHQLWIDKVREGLEKTGSFDDEQREEFLRVVAILAIRGISDFEARSAKRLVQRIPPLIIRSDNQGGKMWSIRY